MPQPQNQVPKRTGSGAPCASAVPLSFRKQSSSGRPTDTAAPPSMPRSTVRLLIRLVIVRPIGPMVAPRPESTRGPESISASLSGVPTSGMREPNVALVGWVSLTSRKLLSGGAGVDAQQAGVARRGRCRRRRRPGCRTPGPLRGRDSPDLRLRAVTVLRRAARAEDLVLHLLRRSPPAASASGPAAATSTAWRRVADGRRSASAPSDSARSCRRDSASPSAPRLRARRRSSRKASLMHDRRATGRASGSRTRRGAASTPARNACSPGIDVAADGVSVEALDEARAQRRVARQHLAEPARRRRTARRQLAGRIDHRAVLGLAIDADAVHLLEAPGRSGSIRLWQPAHTSLVDVRRQALARGAAIGAALLGELEKSMSPGGGGTSWQSSTSRTNLPRRVGELRPGCERSASRLTWVSRPARGAVGGKLEGLPAAGGRAPAPGRRRRARGS